MRIYYHEDGRIDCILEINGAFQPKITLPYLEVPNGTVANPLQHEVIDGELVARVTLTEDLRSASLEKITQARGKARLLYVTDLPLQGSVYEEKRRDALAFFEHPAPTEELFPEVYNEVGVTAPSAEEVALVWLHMNDRWKAASRFIEKATLTASNSVLAATTVAEAELALSTMHSLLSTLSEI